MPVVFVPHGGGPWPFVDIGMPRIEVELLAGYLRGLRELTATPPRALLVISAHWEAALPTVMTGARPPLLYDYSGFPPEAYRIAWPAPGDPELAARVGELLAAAGIDSDADERRGYDHGTFIPLALPYPKAEMPTVQLSLIEGLDPQAHLDLGRALAPLRDEGVLIIGSGMSFHNLRGFGDPRVRPIAHAFDTWLRDAATRAPQHRDRELARWATAPGARLAHPREEHLLPLMVVAGAAGDDRGRIGFSGHVFGTALSGYHFG
jgi:aromatic ring-opening dioxygenase catalytic subunit (LigB family)